MKHRVFAYVIRSGVKNHELLLFRHLGYAEASLQIPGGTVEPNESFDDAVRRELREESGIEYFTILSQVCHLWTYQNGSSLPSPTYLNVTMNFRIIGISQPMTSVTKSVENEMSHWFSATNGHKYR